MAVTVAEFHRAAKIEEILEGDDSPLRGHFSEDQITKIVAIAVEHLAGKKIEQAKLIETYTLCLSEFEKTFADIVRESIEQPFNAALASCIQISTIQTPPTPRRERRKSCIVM